MLFFSDFLVLQCMGEELVLSRCHKGHFTVVLILGVLLWPFRSGKITECQVTVLLKKYFSGIYIISKVF